MGPIPGPARPPLRLTMAGTKLPENVGTAGWADWPFDKGAQRVCCVATDNWKAPNQHRRKNSRLAQLVFRHTMKTKATGSSHARWKALVSLNEWILALAIQTLETILVPRPGQAPSKPDRLASRKRAAYIEKLFPHLCTAFSMLAASYVIWPYVPGYTQSIYELFSPATSIQPALVVGFATPLPCLLQPERQAGDSQVQADVMAEATVSYPAVYAHFFGAMFARSLGRCAASDSTRLCATLAILAPHLLPVVLNIGEVGGPLTP